MVLSSIKLYFFIMLRMIDALNRFFCWYFGIFLGSMGLSLPCVVFLGLAGVFLTNGSSTIDEQRSALTRRIEFERHSSVLVQPNVLVEHELNEFETRFSFGDSRRELALKRLFATAQSAGLTLEDGDYRREEELSGGWGRYIVTLPLKGSAPAIQDFAVNALKNDPSISLAGITFNRGRVGDGEIDARMIFNVHYRKRE